MIHRFPLVLIVVTVLLGYPARAALPPGYEDDMWCPLGYCDRNIIYGNGFVGPAHSFHECFDPVAGVAAGEIWTGSLTETVPPEGWVENPGECDESRMVAAPDEQLDARDNKDDLLGTTKTLEARSGATKVDLTIVKTAAVAWIAFLF